MTSGLQHGSKTAISLGCSSRSDLTISNAGDSRVSDVLGLNAEPSTAIFLPVRVLFRHLITRFVKRSRWYSFIFTTCRQYSAISSRPSDSAKYTRLKISFLKQLPPNPIPALRNLLPMRGSQPIELATSSMSAPEHTQIALIELMLLMRWASIELATSLASSDE